jgi:hypothetical protein
MNTKLLTLMAITAKIPIRLIVSPIDGHLRRPVETPFQSMAYTGQKHGTFLVAGFVVS